MDGLGPIWPASRTQIDGVRLGDAWPLSTMPSDSTTAPWETIVPFHKLTQWLCYSLMQPMAVLMHIHFAGTELMTGLPEYRNGGLGGNVIQLPDPPVPAPAPAMVPVPKPPASSSRS